MNTTPCSKRPENAALTMAQKVSIRVGWAVGVAIAVGGLFAHFAAVSDQVSSDAWKNEGVVDARYPPAVAEALDARVAALPKKPLEVLYSSKVHKSGTVEFARCEHMATGWTICDRDYDLPRLEQRNGAADTKCLHGKCQVLHFSPGFTVRMDEDGRETVTHADSIDYEDAWRGPAWQWE